MNPRISLPALALAALLAGCVKPSATVEIFQGCAPPTPDSTTGSCTFESGSCSLVPLDTYVLDVDLASDFFLGVEVHNQLANNANADTGLGNTHNAFVDKYSVTYSGPVGIGGISGAIQQTIASEGSAVVGVHFVDTASLDALSTAAHASADPLHYVVSLKLSGKFGDQSTFETGPRTFGLDVCAGCLGVPTCPSGSTVAACPGIGQSPASITCIEGSATTFTIGGAVSGLTATDFTITCNGTTVDVAAGSTDWTFPTALATGATYVCVAGTPTGQTCTLANGSGTVGTSNVTNIDVTCG